MPLDLSDLASVQAFAAGFRGRFSRLDILVNNAGLNTFGPGPTTTHDGFEMCWGVNYLGHYHLTSLLLDLLDAAPDGRLVNLSSLMHRMGTADLLAHTHARSLASYNNSKLAMNLHARHIATRGSGSPLLALAVNPGAVNSDIWRGLSRFGSAFMALARLLFSLVFLNTEQGSRTSVFAAAGPRAALASGAYLVPYYVPRAPSRWAPEWLRWALEAVGPAAPPRAVQPAPLAADDALAARLAAESARMVREALAARR